MLSALIFRTTEGYDQGKEEHMNPLFAWNDLFLTRLPTVDEQHCKLVQLINELGELVLSNDLIDIKSFSKIRDGLIEYSRLHFAYEERLMAQEDLDKRHIEQHTGEHRRFALAALELSRTDHHEHFCQGPQLANYLVHWLACHLLQMDQSMARQIQAIRTGVAPQTAFEAEHHQHHAEAEPILHAMDGLFCMLSERNHELRQLNLELEEKVKVRTTELEAANRQLQRLSTHDDLTDLPNRRFAMMTLHQLWEEWKRYGSEFSLILLDADHFKQVNDRFGHAQGDELIRFLASTLCSTVRASDVVCRLGGDEFLVICPHGSLRGTLDMAHKILGAFHPFFTPEGTPCWEGKVSLGVAQACPSTESPEVLLQEADASLYAAKERGGGQVVARGAQES